MTIFDPETRKLIVVVLVGPLAILPALLLLSLATALLDTTDAGTSFLLFSLIGLEIAYPVSIVFGVPILLVLKHFNQLNLVTLIAAAILIVMTLSILLPFSLSLMFLYIYCALAVATGSWWVYKVA